jgi:hypothetical protein
MAKGNSQVSWEVATLNGLRKRFRDYSKALEFYEGFTKVKVWLEEYHGNKLVRSISKGAQS